VYALEVLLRHHLELARRMTPTVGYRGGIATYETRRIAVGFADLTGSTALAARVDFTDLAAALEAFEQLATDVVHRYGGRVVKLIGDEVMFSAGDANAACAIANDLVDEASTRPELPPLRVGIAVGDVLNRAGDCFGPVVNLAARLVDRAEPDTVLLPAAAAAELDPARFESSGGTTMELRGFDDPVPVTRVYRARR
jgi:adenylate cyclase